MMMMRMMMMMMMIDDGDIQCLYTSQSKSDVCHYNFDYEYDDDDIHFWKRSIAKKAMEYIPQRG